MSVAVIGLRDAFWPLRYVMYRTEQATRRPVYVIYRTEALLSCLVTGSVNALFGGLSRRPTGIFPGTEDFYGTLVPHLPASSTTYPIGANGFPAPVTLRDLPD